MATQSNNELIIEKGNGKGYLYHEPLTDKENKDVLASLANDPEGRFSEIATIVGLAAVQGSVLLEGPPGAGKSNICHDIEARMIKIGAPLLRISMHINAGTLRHAEKTTELLNTYRTRENSGITRLFMLDNADYGGYRGSSRTRNNAAEYAQCVIPELIKAVSDEKLTVLGTAHDEIWRQSKWTWGDSSIDAPARELLEAFNTRYEFMGAMPKEAVRKLLTQRGADDEVARHTAHFLAQAGLLNFFYANHVDYEQFMLDKAQALQSVKDGRDERYGFSREKKRNNK